MSLTHGRSRSYAPIAALTALAAFSALTAQVVFASEVPNLVGEWSGDNHTISGKKGLKTWRKTIHITEQTDRRFRGYFTYSAGRKDFFGVIYPDNRTFTWVASDSKGYNHGLLMSADKMSACYVESWEEATAGCAELERVK